LPWCFGGCTKRRKSSASVNQKRIIGEFNPIISSAIFMSS